MSEPQQQPQHEPDEQNDDQDTIPDPSDVTPLGDNVGVYQRDEDGQLRPLPPEVIEWDGEFHSVRFRPIPIGELEDYQELGEDIAMSELCEILADKVHTPSRTIDEWADTDPEQIMAVMGKLIENALGEEPDSEFHEEIREELESRDGGPGN